MGLRHLLPTTTRLYLRVWQRRCADFISGRYRQFAITKKSDNILSWALTVQQPITGGEEATNKIKNLTLAINSLQFITIEPGQHFSFWHVVGNPSALKGYLKSRSIVQGQLTAETGGGLCQLSGLIYLLALKAGLSVTERHAHSKDIYREEERFTPLGSDATVAYGYKDLRFINTLPHPIQLQFTITPQQLSGNISSPMPIVEKNIRFSYTQTGHTVEAITFINDTVLHRNTYIRMHPINSAL